MSLEPLRCERLDNVGQIRAHSAAWDDLWRRSEVSLPTSRAELVAQWIEHFARNTRLGVLVVWHGATMAAALPMVARRIGRLLGVGSLTMNYWSPNGELLFDPAEDVDAVLGLLTDGLKQQPWPLAWFDMIPTESPWWTAMIDVLRRRGVAVEVHRRWEVGRVATEGDFDVYWAARSKNLRRSVHKDLARLDRRSPTRFRFDAPTADQTPRQLRELFDLEYRGWKGDSGGAVLATEGMIDFYRRQAEQLAAWGDLRIAVLECEGRPIAFELGWIGKGVYHSYKVGYDPAWREFGPGHLLRHHLIRRCFDQTDIHAVDFQGPRTEALDAWTTDRYPIARLVASPRPGVGRTLWHGYRLLARAVRQCRGS